MMTHDQIRAIADAYDRAEHTPEHPSYRAFVAETLEQYRAMTQEERIWIIPTRGSDVAYAYAGDMFHDLARYGRLIVATDGSPFAPGHPLDLGINHDRLDLPEPSGDFLTVNFAFRAVHDYFGHFKGRHSFETFDGEVAAYQEHKRRYSPAAWPALFGETIGQLCYFYARGVYVPVQKAAILPQELMTV